MKIKIPLSIRKAKECRDIIDVEIALEALENWCIRKHKITPEENIITNIRLNELIHERNYYKKIEKNG